MKSEQVIRSINANLLADGCLVSAGELVKIYHAAVSIETRTFDKSENLNFFRYKSISGFSLQRFAKIALIGLFKPAEFIHEFEEYYSLPGYLDEIVLDAFFQAVDARANDESLKTFRGLAEYLSFIYIGFLVIHPFIDRNGRVARALLDYHYERAGSPYKPVWREKEFKDYDKHKEAFQIFFCKEAQVRTRKSLELDHPFPIRSRLKPNLLVLASHIELWSNKIVRDRTSLTTESVSKLSEIILKRTV